MSFNRVCFTGFCFVYTYPFIIASIAALLFCVAFFYLLLHYSNKKNSSKPDISYTEELLRTTIEIHEQTFINIRQQIHDSIGQTLSLAKLNLNTSVNNITPEKMVLTEELVSKTITELRDISKSLYSDALTDFVKAIKTQMDTISKITSLYTKFITPSYSSALSEEQTIILVRCVQVLLNNIVRYGKATRITTEIISSADNLEICINDDGENVYFKMNETKNSIAVIEKRLELIAAHLSFETQKEKGNFARIQLAVQGNV